MYNLQLSAEQLEIRDMVHDFVAHEIKPAALKMERLDACDRSLLADALDKASQLGLRTLALSEDLGGAGADALTCCIVAEELAAGDIDIASVLMETARLAHELFDRRMTAEQRARFLPPFVADNRHHLGSADHEPAVETALGLNYHRPTAAGAAVKTNAARAANGDWIINGVKDCVANAPLARLFAVEVAADGPKGQDVQTLLVPRDAPGLAITPHDGTNRWYHGACGELIFKDCRIPSANLLGPDGDSPPAGVAEINGHEAVLLAALNLGVGRAAYEAALDYAHLRIQGGRPIIEHQAIGTKLADIAIKLSVARNAVWQAAWAADHPEACADRSLPDVPLAIIARVYTSEAVFQAAKDAAEVFGAMGVMRDMPLQKYVHDARVCLHSGDGNADARFRIAEALAQFHRSTPAAVAAE